MQRRLRTLFEGNLALRIGINTGEVVAGRPREGSSFVSGDAVNVAARLEGAAEPGEILVGERTNALVWGAFELGQPRRVEAKGKEDGIVGAPLLAALTLKRPRGVRGLHRTFVGRGHELDMLLHRFQEAHEWARRPLDFVDALSDPDKVAETNESMVPVDVVLGRFDAARTMAEAFDAATQRLSPHHPLHGIAMTTELEELCANWIKRRELIPRVERAVEENLSTPCVRNVRTLLVCAGASRILGDGAEAARLEAKAEAIGMQGYDLTLSAPRLRLALLRGDLDAVADRRGSRARGRRSSDSMRWPSIGMPIRRGL